MREPYEYPPRMTAGQLSAWDDVEGCSSVDIAFAVVKGRK
jgi:hypothetical protein